jgi:cardiolipin synthase C
MKVHPRITLITCLGVLPLISYCSASDAENSLSDPFQAHSDQAHQVQIIDQGTATLEKRLEMISGAQKTLDLEYFSFDPDQSGRLVLQALLTRAMDKAHPIQMRLLLDYNDAHKYGITPGIAQVLVNAGVQVRYFNPGSVADFSKYNHRDHRKLIIADAADSGEFCGGGRNMSDNYLDLGTVRTRIDRDVCVRGPLTSAVEKTFDAYWDNTLSKPASLASAKNQTPSPNVQEAQDVFKTSELDTKLLTQVHQVGSEMLKNDPVYAVHSISFISDRPALNKEAHIMAGSVENFVQGTQKKLTIENMLYLPTGSEKKLIDQVAAQGKDVTILTDSPPASQSKQLSLMAVAPEKKAVQNGAKVYLESGAPQDGQVFLAPHQDPAKTVWGTHTKTIVRDSRDTSIGSFNLDPRSANINFEDQVVIYDSPELATAVEKDIQTRTTKAHPLDAKGNYSDCGTDPEGESLLTRTANKAINAIGNIIKSQF